MDVQGIAVAFFLAVGVGAVLACCVGLLAARNPYARLHFIGPASIMGPSSIAAAIVIQEGLSQAAVKALLITLAFFVMGPILTHITARAILARESSGENPRRSEGMRKGE